MEETQATFHPNTGIDTSDGALPRSDSRPCGARPAGTEPRSGASSKLGEPAQGDGRDKKPRLPAGCHHRRSIKKKGGGVAAPNGLELCCPAAQALPLHCMRRRPGSHHGVFARQPGQHQRDVRRHELKPRRRQARRESISPLHPGSGRRRPLPRPERPIHVRHDASAIPFAAACR